YQLGTAKDLENTQVLAGSEDISWKGKKILVADDEPFNRVLIEILLQKMEIKADLVENGAEAIDKLREKSYDLVLLDLQMPEKDGFEVARETRAEISKELPLIAVTATATKNEADLAKEAGMNELLLKPFEEKDLHRVLNKYFATTEAANP
ncbi:MAG: response regulator, partial [Bacteroidota bacterium]